MTKINSTPKFLRLAVLLAILAILSLSLTALTRAQEAPVDLPPDPTTDIPWSAGVSGVADIQAAFNNARATENAQLSINMPMMTMPSQAAWDAMSDSEKALWLINSERQARGIHPLHGVESNVTSVAQYYADYLLNNNAWGHTADGRDPWQRLADNPTIGACSDFLPYAENLSVSMTSGTSVALPVERAVYGWNYDDGTCCNWGHRYAMLYYNFTDNGGTPGQEGFMGIGRASGPYQGWNFAEMIVYNVFDPCATWDYGSVQPTPTVGPPPVIKARIYLPVMNRNY